MRLLALIFLLAACDKLPKPLPPCQLSLHDTPEERECERACKLATYAADNRRTRLAWCLTDMCRAELVPTDCRGGVYVAADQDVLWRKR